jgi:hypothetical protein
MRIPYAGGPVVRRPLVYASFWGPGWASPDQQEQAAGITQFHQDLLNSEFMNVLAQYGCPGAGTGAFVNASRLPWVPKVLTVAQYQEIIQSRVFTDPLPERQNVGSPVLLIYLDETTIINDPATGRQLNFLAAYDSGYHDFFTTPSGHRLYCGFIAHSPDIDTTTIVASHEFAEIITDPEYSAWTPDDGWTEIGDICEEGQGSVTLGVNTWAVQTIWSNVDNACICQAPGPIPEIQTPGMQGTRMAYKAGWRRGRVSARP